MNVFFWKKKASQELQEDAPKEEAISEIRRNDFVDDTEPAPFQYGNMEYGTRMPIDALYEFLNNDYEKVGYDDALCNADVSYKESKKKIIKNELKRMIELITLRYKSDLRDMDVKISILEEQGLMNTAASLKARKETYLEHMEKIKEMQCGLNSDDESILNMISSYERGFLKGLAAQSCKLLGGDRNEN